MQQTANKKLGEQVDGAFKKITEKDSEIERLKEEILELKDKTLDYKL